MILVLINYNNPDTRQSAVFFIHMNLILNYISIKLNDYYYTVFCFFLVQIWM